MVTRVGLSVCVSGCNTSCEGHQQVTLGPLAHTTSSITICIISTWGKTHAVRVSPLLALLAIKIETSDLIVTAVTEAIVTISTLAMVMPVHHESPPMD